MSARTKLAAIAVVAATALGGALTGCSSQSDVASQNISTDAESFKIDRQIVFYNSITDKYMVTVNGRCSVDDSPDLSGTLAVTCKVGPNKFIKDYLGKSDNVAWFSLQSKPANVDVYRYEVVFKPETIIPNVDVQTSAK